MICLTIRRKGSSSSGWYAPPTGTHTGEKHRAVGSGKAMATKKPAEEKPKMVPPTSTQFRGHIYYASKREESSIRRALKVLPQEHADSVPAISVQESSDYSTAGRCSLNSGRITLYGSMYKGKLIKLWNPGTVVHEAAHAVEGRMARYGYRPFGATENAAELVAGVYRRLAFDAGGYKKIRTAASSKMYGVRRSKGFPTLYSQTNRHELFAESYKLYVKKPSLLLKADPELYGIMRDYVFGGIEYGKT